MAKIKRLKTVEDIDRLSLLPDAILIHILSLLPIKSAVSTSVLSRQWRYLWTHITNIVFSKTCLPSSSHDLSAAVNRIIPQLTSNRIDCFHLFFNKKWEEFSDIEFCIRDICTRNPKQIVVENLYYKEFILERMPACIFQCQSLVDLTLIEYISIQVPNEGFVATLPKLKKLHLFTDCGVLAAIIRGCPLLEDLNLFIYRRKRNHFLDSIDLSAHNLKRLVMKERYRIRNSVQLSRNLLINVSKLEEITLDFGMGLVQFIGDSGSLIKADICSGYMYLEENHLSNVKRMVELISGLKSLSLDIVNLNDIRKLKYDLVPIFDKLYELRIEIESDMGSIKWWNDLLVFLRWCPCLKVLHLVFTTYYGVYDEYLEAIMRILDCDKEIELLSVYLNQRGTIKVEVTSQEYDFCEKLFGLQNPSACEIKFKGHYVNVSNKSFIPRRRSIRLAKHKVV
ncbi:F-box/LRR-repeat protein At3g26922-like [Chenopodium quinoa]|uniref:F-box/LRR-repeat protein At3g26922-like n=1 Tax=Chenopodium quinoa TaxID=63459 RepID=UPI000B791035|nr:F-box/LRR-repeat protein At3g26922-like [Chenopodium quinoa]